MLTIDLAGRVHAVSAGARPVDTPGFILARLAGAFAAAAAFRWLVPTLPERAADVVVHHEDEGENQPTG